MILSNIKQFIAINKRILYYVGFFLVIFLFSSDVTFAASDTEMIKTVAEWVGALMKGISLLLGLMTYLATLFLSPEWINGSIFGMSTKFKEVWILVSNVVYFIFAFILIWIAFMNIIGKQGESYQLKQALPKFIVGVLIVPFSWFLVQFILSISAILTVSALTLPIDTFPDYKSVLENVEIPKKCIIDLTSGKKGDTSKAVSFIDCSKGGKMKIGDAIYGGNSTNSIYGIISMYTYGVTSFDTISTITADDIAGSITVLGDLLVKIVFDFLFIIIYSILIIALGLVLMIRGIYIWIYIMISPIFGLMYFFDKKEGNGFFEKFNIKEFIALAMVPVYAMLALSFGLLFMYVVGSGLSGTKPAGSIAGNSISVGKSEESGNSEVSIGTGEDSFKLEIVGAVSTDVGDATGFLSAIGGGALGIVGALILKLFGIVVLWGTVLAALGASKITSAVIKPLEDFGGSVGKIMTSAPGNIPIFNGQSMSSMSTAAGTVQSSINTKQQQRGTKLGQKFVKSDKLTEEYQNLKAKVASNGDLNANLNNLHEVMKKASLDKLASNGSGVDALATQLSRVNGAKGFTDSAEAKKLIDEIKKNGTGNTNLIEKNMALLDKISKPGKLSIMGGSDNVIKDNVKDYFGSNSKESSSLNNDSKEKPSINQNDKTIKFGDSVINIELNSDDHVTDLKTAKDELAKYVANNLLNTAQLNELISELNLTDEAVDQLKAYFKEEDGKIIFDTTGNGNKSIKDFAATNTNS